MAIDIHWIRDNDSLGQHCAEWQNLPFVALDTEFMRVDTFYPIAGLIQIGDGESLEEIRGEADGRASAGARCVRAVCLRTCGVRPRRATTVWCARAWCAARVTSP